MDRSEIGRNLNTIRRLKMWTQGKLAEEAGISPTTVSGIESGRISHPHFGTLHKMAEALGVEPQDFLSMQEPPGRRKKEAAVPLTLEWAMSVREEEFERELDEASMESLSALLKELDEEQDRLQQLCGEFPLGSEQQRFIKRQIRNVAAHSSSVGTSIKFHGDREGADEAARGGDSKRRSS